MVTIMAVAGSSRGDQEVWYTYGSSWKFSWRSRSMVTIMAVARSAFAGHEICLQQ